MRVRNILFALAGTALAHTGAPNEAAMNAKIDSVKADFWNTVNPLQDALSEGVKILNYYDIGMHSRSSPRLAELKEFKDLRHAVRELKDDIKALDKVNQYVTSVDMVKLDDFVSTMEHLEGKAAGKGWEDARLLAREAKEKMAEAVGVIRAFMQERSLPQDFTNALEDARNNRGGVNLNYLARAHLDRMIASNAWTHNTQWLHWTSTLLHTIRSHPTSIDGIVANLLFKRFKDYLYDNEQHKKHFRYHRDRYGQLPRRQPESDTGLLDNTPLQKAINNWGPGIYHREDWNGVFPMAALKKAYDPRYHTRGFEFVIYDALKQQGSRRLREWYPGPPRRDWAEPDAPPNTPEESFEELSGEEEDRGDLADVGLQENAQSQPAEEDTRPWNDPDRAPAKGAFTLRNAK